MTNHRLRATTALLGAALVLTSAAGPGDASVDHSAHQGAERAAAHQKRIVKPAQVGKAKVGMTVAEAMATGQFNQDVPNPPCGPIALQPKKPFKNAYTVGVVDDEIIAMNIFGSRPRTDTGIKVGSTYRQVKRAYRGEVSKPRDVGYSQWGVYVHTGKKGADRKWLGILFGDAFVEDGPVSGTDTVTFMTVATGKRPFVGADGC